VVIGDFATDFSPSSSQSLKEPCRVIGGVVPVVSMGAEKVGWSAD
jgi:hypothetical protein